MRWSRQHIFYLLLLPIGYFLYTVHNDYSVESPFFYGFAENKETELSRDHDVLVKDILVSQGQMVQEGELLMIVERSDLQQRSQELTFDMDKLATSSKADITELTFEKSAVEQEIKAYRGKVAAEIDEVRAKIRLQSEMLGVIESVPSTAEKPTGNLKATITELQTKERLYIEGKQIEIEAIEKQLDAIAAQKVLLTKKVENQKSILTTEKGKLNIVAPANGVIGNISTKKDELAKAFRTLMTFYQEKPTRVKGYVHENLLILVHIGDSLQIASTLKPDNVVTGVVVGLGSRIVEIPERLRKMPTIKTYGREVIVAIPSDNSFLQKEKVSLNTDIDPSQVKVPLIASDKVEKSIKKTLEVK